MAEGKHREDEQPPRGVSRRELLRRGGLTVAGLVLSACGGPPQSAGETQGPAQAGTSAAGTVAETPAAAADGAQAAASGELSGELIFWGHDQHPLDLAAQGFVKKYPNVKWVSPHPADWGTKLQAALAAGQDVPDLVWLEATQVQDYGCQGALLDVTQFVEPNKDNYHPLKLSEALIATTGHYNGWPGDISVSGYYYRPDKLQELGVGDIDFEQWTYDAFLAMATRIAEQGKYAFVFPGAAWQPIFWFILHQLGGSATPDDGSQITVADDKGIQAMTMVKQIYDTKAGLDVAFWSPPYWAALQEGTLVGDFAAAWAKGFWEAQIKSPEQGAGAWRIARLPGGPDIKYHTGVWGGATLCSLSISKNKDNAIAFMQYALGTPEGAALVGGWGIVPAYRPYLQSSEFTNARSPIFGDWPYNEFWARQEKELSPQYFRRAGWSPIDTAIGQVMPSIMKGELSVPDGMAKIVETARPDFERTLCK